jgi:hypothetical protein
MEMGRKLLKSIPTEKDEIEEQLISDKLTVADGELKLSKIDKNDEKVADEKSRRFVIFLTEIYRKMSKKESIGIYGKTGPTKSTVLGARPPPGEIHKIYRFLLIFTVFRAFNTAGKTVTKVGIYSKPPPKSGRKVIFIQIYRKLPFF